MAGYDIPGGACNILPSQFCMAWASYQADDITWFALKTYFALWELRERRCLLKPDEPRRYTVEEIQSVLNESSLYKVSEALRQLDACGLASFSETDIRFCEYIEQLQSDKAKARARSMLNDIHQKTRSKIVAVPRRLLKLIIRCGRKIVRAATLIGLILTTMLVKKYGVFQGCCKAEWIAKLFGVDAKRVMHERAKLIAEGWFAIIRTSQKVLNRFGVWVVLNLKPSAKPVENPTADNSELQPRPDQNSEQLQPPLKPAPPPDLKTNQQPPGIWTHLSLPKPNWNNLVPQDLTADSRSGALWKQTLDRGLLKNTQANRINFFAAIEHALRVGRQNACGLLRSLVEKGLWDYISQADEFNAIRRLKAMSDKQESGQTSPAYENILSMAACDTGKHARLQEWSKDAITVKIIREDFEAAGIRGPAFRILQRYGYLQDWTQERWDQAEMELGSIE